MDLDLTKNASFLTDVLDIEKQLFGAALENQCLRTLGKYSVSNELRN